MEKPASKTRDFVHLHLHSDYSLLQSTIQLNPLVKQLAESNMAACALTDYGNMYGAVSFYNAMRSNGLRPILGYDAFVASGSRFDRNSSLMAGERPYYQLVLLARNFEGYQNLVSLASMAFTEGYHHKPRIDYELLGRYSGGLIALTGGSDGAIRHYLKQGDKLRLSQTIQQLSEILGKDYLFLELQDHGVGDDLETNREIAEVARRNNLQIVATNDVHYLTEDDAKAHEVLLCLGDGRTINDPARSSLPTSKFYLRTADEMWEIFGAEFPDALENTLRIAEMCDTSLPTGEGSLTLPTFPIPSDSACKTTNEYFRKVVADGFEERRKSVLEPMIRASALKHSIEDYTKRLEIEIAVIERMGYGGYFLIVWDFIKYARLQKIPVGPGRGSAAGSLVAYCLGITDIDPIQYDLLFERFLNPERVSMPDIDIDFCIRGRGEVINHVSELYGRESVCQIITFGTMASKAAIKDVGRVLNMPYGDVERIAKLIPPPFRGRNVSISQAVEQVPELKAAIAADPAVKQLIDLALRVEGCSRHTSVHAAGVVISPKPLHEIVPVAISAKNELTSQYPMGDLEKVGMLKMDFLGLTTLTIISDCLKALKEKTGIEIDWAKIPLSDPKTMELFGEGRTDAVFQFESSGMQEICRRLKPKELEDLSALNALYRPGPLDGGMIEDFILRHKGEKKVEYLIPEMEDILRNTYGVLVYQEQIMQLAQKLAGYSLGEADMMRRAMGKKKREEMAAHEKKFIEGAVKNGIDKKKAVEIFTLMSQFADYGFNRSHSIAYAYLAFQTAYLKAHYPAFFYAAVLSHEADDSAKIYKYSNELRGLGLKMLPADVNESDEGFTPTQDSVRFGLSAIKGMGSATARAIIDARKSGKFTSLFDFVSRVDQGAINRRSLESLTMAGAFDTMKPKDISVNLWRAKLFKSIDNALARGQSVWNDRLQGQSGLFAAETLVDGDTLDQLEDAPAWTQKELSQHEKNAIGFYLSVHPLDEYEPMLEALRIRKIADYDTISQGANLQLAGIVSALQVRWSKRGNRFCTFRLEDKSTGIKCLLWSDAYSKYSGLLADDALLIVEGKVESADGQDITMIVNDIRSVAETVARNARELSIALPRERLADDFLESIHSVLSGESGRCEVSISISINGVIAKLVSGPMRVMGSARLEEELKSMGCSVKWIL